MVQIRRRNFDLHRRKGELATTLPGHCPTDFNLRYFRGLNRENDCYSNIDSSIPLNFSNDELQVELSTAGAKNRDKIQSRRLNRDIIWELFKKHETTLLHQWPAYDGRKTLILAKKFADEHIFTVSTVMFCRYSPCAVIGSPAILLVILGRSQTVATSEKGSRYQSLTVFFPFFLLF